mgnify:FL=1
MGLNIGAGQLPVSNQYSCALKRFLQSYLSQNDSSKTHQNICGVLFSVCFEIVLTTLFCSKVVPDNTNRGGNRPYKQVAQLQITAVQEKEKLDRCWTKYTEWIIWDLRTEFFLSLRKSFDIHTLNVRGFTEFWKEFIQRRGRYSVVAITLVILAKTNINKSLDKNNAASYVTHKMYVHLAPLLRI